jgi:transcriptional/translational regulatory protein YebC/TACO1
VLSDNNNRAVADIGMVLKKAGCKVATPGSVTFNFARKGRLVLKSAIDAETLLDMASAGPPMVLQ